MGFSESVVGLGVFWGILHTAHFFYSRATSKAVSLRPVDEPPAIAVTPFRIQYFTKGLNRLFARLAASYPNFFQVWFVVGSWFGVLAMLMSLLVLSYSIYATLAMQPDEQVLTPVIPGFNLPNSHLLYYFLALAISGILHEIGHAMAAISQGVTVNGFGVFLLLLYPGAYVDLCVEDMVGLSPVRQLRVYCAGVWHNFAICVVCGLIMVSLPWLLLPFYYSGGYDGIAVVDVAEASPLYGHLFPSSIIERVDDCQVNSLEDWQDCLFQSYKGTSLVKTGNCVPRQHIAVLPEEIYNCCQGNDTIVASSLCFIRKYVMDETDTKEACLPVRQTISNPQCETDEDCTRSPDVPMESICMHPDLRSDERLLRIHVLKEPVVLFLGDPRLAYFSVQVTNYLPRISILPLSLPGILEMFMNYTLSLSAALALLNMVPAYYLDGQWALLALVDIMFPKSNYTRKKFLAEAILTSSSALFLFTIILSVYNLM